jgi:AraC-like DNA-binding protein
MMNKDLFRPNILTLERFEYLEIINVLSQGWDNRWTYIKRGGVEAQLQVFTTPRMQFSRVGYSNAIMIESSPPVGSVQLTFVRMNAGICNTHNRKLQKYELVIVKGGEEANYLASDASEIFTLVFETRFFNQVFYSYFGMELERMRSNYRLRIDPDKVDRFLSYLQHWFSFFQKEENHILGMETYLQIEEGIMEHLFSVIVTQQKRKQAKREFDIAQARNILEANIDSIYTIGDLVEELGTNMRTLQYNFKEKLGISPKQYFQNMRLSTVRKELLSTNMAEMHISDVALKYGFFHPSHFSQEYKKMFGETPTQTLETGIRFSF